MNTFRFSPEAEQDLNEIYDYLVSKSPAAAARVIQRIEKHCRLLAQFPHLGTARDDYLPGLREFVSGTYVILYRPEQDGIEIVRVFRGSVNIAAHFPAP